MRLHSRSRAAVADPWPAPCEYILLRKSALHLAAMSNKSHPPSVLRKRSVETGTRKVAPFQMKYVKAAVNCWMQSRGQGIPAQHTVSWLASIYERRVCGVLDTRRGGRSLLHVIVLVQ